MTNDNSAPLMHVIPPKCRVVLLRLSAVQQVISFQDRVYCLCRLDATCQVAIIVGKRAPATLGGHPPKRRRPGNYRGTQRTEHAAMTPRSGLVSKAPRTAERVPRLMERASGVILRKPRPGGARISYVTWFWARGEPGRQRPILAARGFLMPCRGRAGRENRDCPRLAIAFDETAP